METISTRPGHVTTEGVETLIEPMVARTEPACGCIKDKGWSIRSLQSWPSGRSRRPARTTVPHKYAGLCKPNPDPQITRGSRGPSPHKNVIGRSFREEAAVFVGRIIIGHLGLTYLCIFCIAADRQHATYIGWWQVTSADVLLQPSPCRGN
jgi:hypothetical protein